MGDWVLLDSQGLMENPIAESSSSGGTNTNYKIMPNVICSSLTPCFMTCLLSNLFYLLYDVIQPREPG